MINLFFFTETNRRPWAEHVARGARCLTVDSDATSLSGLLALAPKGSARSGVFEIQTDEGIWSRVDGRQFGRLNKLNATFKTWEQLENNEA